MPSAMKNNDNDGNIESSNDASEGEDDSENVYEAVENPPSMSAGHSSHRTLRLDIPKFKQPGLTRDQTKNPPSITLGDPPPVQVPLCVHKMRPWDGIKPGAPYYCHNFQGWLTSSRVRRESSGPQSDHKPSFSTKVVHSSVGLVEGGGNSLSSDARQQSVIS
ncbi:MAG: hypothetical protein J3Q66DRAFT_372331 [Benniella sp.]|nr:MAG: hypothetical protein J3Q66DRAFT_372331 [Benniella sp.]